MDKTPQRVQDMTQGNPLSLIIRFAIPLLIGNIFQQIYSVVDTMVVGYHLGDSGLAAIGAVSSLYSLLINFANGLNTGYGIVVTQRFGAKNRSAMKQAVAGIMVLDALVAVALTALALSFLGTLMGIMNTPAEIFDLSFSYISVIYMGLIATICYNMFATILRAVGNSRSPLYFLILSSIVNILLDLLFVAVWNLGITGVAFATVIAQAVSAVSCGIYVFRNYRDILPEAKDFRISGSTFRELFSMGISLALMSSLVDLGSVIFSRANNLLGETCITAYAASRKLLMIMIQPVGSIAEANSTFTGQNWGAGQHARIRSTLKQVVLLELGCGAVFSSIMFLFGAPLIRFLTGTEDAAVVEYAVMSLRIHFAAFPFLGVLFAIRNAVQAMGHKVAPVVSSFIELSTKFLAAILLIPRLGFLGSCITEPVTWILMVIFLTGYYLYQRKNLFPETA